MKHFSLLKNHKYQAILILLVILYILYFTIISFLRYDNFYAGRFDLGNMDQVVWNTVHGHIFQATQDNGIFNTRLTAHADFILLLLAPAYLLWEDPRMLLLIQTITIALGALFIFLISQKILKNKNLSLLFSFLFLINPSLQQANLYDFHGVVLSTTFLLAAFYFLLCSQYARFLIFAILAGITKEQLWIIIALLGLYAAFFKKKWVLGLIIFLISGSLFYFLIWHLIPNTSGSQHFAVSYYSDFGNSPTGVIKNIIFSPWQVLRVIFEKERIDYLYKLFSPLGFLSLFAPLYLIFTLPDLFINLLSNNGNLHQIDFQYTAVITPFIFISAIFGVERLRTLLPKMSLVFILVYLIGAGLYSAYDFGPLPGAKNPNLDMLVKPQEKKEIINLILNQIPSNKSIAATNNLGAHIAHRRSTFTIPLGIDRADIVIFLLNDQFAQPSLAKQKEITQKLKTDKNYRVIFEKDDFIVFEKKI